MAFKISKGSAVQTTIGTTLTTIAQVTQFSTSGSEVGINEVTTLDQSGAGRAYEVNGFTEGGSVSLTGFFDPTNSTHQAITDGLTTPANDVNMNLIWTSTATSSDWAFVGIHQSFDVSVALNDHITFDAGIKIDGLPTYQS